MLGTLLFAEADATRQSRVFLEGHTCLADCGDDWVLPASAVDGLIHPWLAVHDKTESLRKEILVRIPSASAPHHCSHSPRRGISYQVERDLVDSFDAHNSVRFPARGRVFTYAYRLPVRAHVTERCAA